MTRPLIRVSSCVLPAAALLLASSSCWAASWQTISDYGGSTNMVIYVPDNVDDSPGIAVALHSCGNQ